MRSCPSSSTTLSAILGLAVLSSARSCQNITVEVPVDARNAVFNLTAPSSNIAVTNYILNQAQQGHNYSSTILTGYASIQKTYQIAATYCEPDSGPSTTLQLLTHGIGFDRTYWDVSINGYNYSYVERATDEYGFSTFAWDRLGIAQSQHGEAINEIQSSLEIAALYTLTKQLRSGKIPGISCPFSKVVHVGHSFGSIQSYSLAVLHPEVTDGLVLTGFTQATAFVPYFLLGGNFVMANGVASFKDYPNGYLAAGDPSGVQTNFFSPGAFSPELLNLGYNSGQPVTVGELLTIAAQTSSPNPLTGPVLIITGGRDIPFCGGDCRITGNASLPNYLEMSRAYFPKTSKFEAVVVGEAGHGLNLEYSHPYTYGTILDFVTQNVGK
ncbi:hypothetical protein N0V93_007028 [Gnomoniopsis smithogilvyi]|uniref:AB hydrolase-1 domain-containing protein n=1 Tax=Gnomoniopsis smithogilvyi TaxID=1191159 RepID=A0A9W8YPB5_9PEZI|nr:hypothetical protein N0V93_007028 [Gnomoniopsis smithogilvyi]